MHIAELSASVSSAGGMRCPHLLVVNRDPGVVDAARRLLRGTGGNLTTTNAARSAAALSALLNPDLIVVDLALDEPDLTALVGRLSTNPYLRRIPVILTSTDPAMLARARTHLHRRGGRLMVRLASGLGESVAAADTRSTAKPGNAIGPKARIAPGPDGGTRSWRA